MNLSHIYILFILNVLIWFEGVITIIFPLRTTFFLNLVKALTILDDWLWSFLLIFWERKSLLIWSRCLRLHNSKRSLFYLITSLCNCQFCFHWFYLFRRGLFHLVYLNCSWLSFELIRIYGLYNGRYSAHLGVYIFS